LHNAAVGVERLGTVEFQNLVHRNGFAFAVIVLTPHDLCENLAVDDPGIALVGADAGVAMGQFLAKFFIKLVFVAEAAHESPASSGDLGGIERRLLNLGGTHGNGSKRLEELFAAAMLAALFVVGDETGFIAGADLAELDAGVEFVSKVTDEAAEIDALFGGEVEEDAFAAEDVFDVDDFHGQAVAIDQFAREIDVFAFVLVELGLLGKVLDGGDTQDTTGVGERIVLAAGFIDVVDELVAGNGFIFVFITPPPPPPLPLRRWSRWW